MKEHGFKIFEQVFFANVNEHFKKFRINSGIYDYPTLLIYDGKRVLELKQKQSELLQSELLYIHFQNRKNIKIDHTIDKSFILSDQEFINFNPKLLKYYFASIGQKETEKDKKTYYQNFLKDHRKNSLKKIKKEFTYSHIFHFSKLVNLVEAKKWFLKNKIR